MIDLTWFLIFSPIYKYRNENCLCYFYFEGYWYWTQTLRPSHGSWYRVKSSGIWRRVDNHLPTFQRSRVLPSSGRRVSKKILLQLSNTVCCTKRHWQISYHTIPGYLANLPLYLKKSKKSSSYTSRKLSPTFPTPTHLFSFFQLSQHRYFILCHDRKEVRSNTNLTVIVLLTKNKIQQQSVVVPHLHAKTCRFKTSIYTKHNSSELRNVTLNYTSQRQVDLSSPSLITA